MHNININKTEMGSGLDGVLRLLYKSPPPLAGEGQGGGGIRLKHEA